MYPNNKWGVTMRRLFVTYMKSIIYVYVVALFPVAVAAQNVVFVVIDGARYSETLGDPSRTWVPEMDALTHQGTYIDEFYNDGYTYTSRAIPALWCGSWTEVRDTTVNEINTQYAVDPTIFEYYRKQTGASADSCYYVLKSLSSLWLPSFHPDYGPDYWPNLHSVGATDEDVLHEAQSVIATDHPQLLWVYFADVDYAGHHLGWEGYTRAIEIADSLVGELWATIQADPVYQDNTTMFVTNDHGRHTGDDFAGHGDDCEGCRHIMFLAIGPTVAQNQVTTLQRVLPDAMVTAAHMLDINTELATGDVCSEIFETSGIAAAGVPVSVPRISLSNAPNPFNATTRLSYQLDTSTEIEFSVFDASGRRIQVLAQGWRKQGTYTTVWNGVDRPSGVYFCRLSARGSVAVHRIVLLK